MKEIKPEQEGKILDTEQLSAPDLSFWEDGLSEDGEEEKNEQAYYEQRRRERHERIQLRRKRRRRNRILAGLLSTGLVAAAAGFFYGEEIQHYVKKGMKNISGNWGGSIPVSGDKKEVLSEITPSPQITETPLPEITETPLPEITEAPLPQITDAPLPTLTPEPRKPQDTVDEKKKKAALKKAKGFAQQYDYDRALKTLKRYPDQEDKDIAKAISRYKKKKSSCVEYPLEKITHVFFHTLINDTSRAFDGDYKEGGYNQVMTTVAEFNRILEILYEKGYVLVSPHDMAQVEEDGSMTRGRIFLPQGKTPIVMSQDDVSYYHYMDGDGFASKLVLDEQGQVKAQYVQGDGSVVVGNYDMVPILDDFVKKHPDFSYRGRKGILAMTGYNGVLGYRTDIAYKTGENLQDNQKEFLEANPDFDYEQEVENAKAVAKAMKKNGWEFASHTWGHRNAEALSAKELKKDNKKWEAYVAPILGKTDMIIFAFGADIGDWQEYSLDNEKYAYYKSRGYHYYCNVDSNQYWVQITDQYFRQGRRNLDGYRMYYNPEMLSDLFDVSEVWDQARPVPVPSMLSTEGENG